MRLLCLAAISSVMLAGALRAQGSDTTWSPAAKRLVQGVLDSAAADHLPLGPLSNRVLEAKARGTPVARLIDVLRAHADSMRAVRSILADASDAELDAGATALRGGVSRRALERVREVRSAGRGTVAMLVLSDLVRRGVQGNDAERAVMALGTRQNDEVLLELQHDYAASRDTQRGQSLNRIVERLERRATVRPPEGPCCDDTAGARFDWMSMTVAPSALPSSTSGRLYGQAGVQLATLGPSRLWGMGNLATGEDRTRWRLGLESTTRAGRLGGFELGVHSYVAFAQRGVFRSGTIPDTALAGERVSAHTEAGVGLASERLLPAHLSLLTSANVRVWSLTLTKYGQVGVREVGRSDSVAGGGASPSQPVFGYHPVTSTRSSALATIGLQRKGTLVELEGVWAPRLSSTSGAFEPTPMLAWRATQTLTRELGMMVQYAPNPDRRFWDAGDLGAATWRLGFLIRSGARTRPVAPKRPEATMVTFSHRRETRGSSEDGRLIIEISAPLARVVELEGDFTDWKAQQLERGSSGLFVGRFDAPVGLSRLRMRIDEGEWVVPPGLATVVDDFGGLVGVIAN